jgi:hypothetical protein
VHEPKVREAPRLGAGMPPRDVGFCPSCGAPCDVEGDDDVEEGGDGR